MIDLHSHILPGIDDGVATLDDAVRLAAAAADDGITAIAATPHVSRRYPTTPADMERALARVRAAVEQYGVPVAVLPGGEVTVDAALAMTEATRRRFSLGGSGAYLLVEFPYDGWPLHIAALADDLGRQGVTPVIAHPERNADVRADPERLRPLVEAGALAQVTAASLDGRGGRTLAAAAAGLIDAGLAHLVASDAHAPGVRAVGLTTAVATIHAPRLARWLVEDVPAAIAAGEPAPPRPSGSARRRSWWRR